MSTASNVPSSHGIYRRQTRCRLCHSSDLKLVTPLEAIPVAEKYADTRDLASRVPLVPIDIFMCGACRGVQIADVIDPEYLWSSYTYWSGQTPAIVQHFEEFAAEIKARFFPEPANFVIDVGSNDGSLLKAFRSRGFSVLGVDPATELAAHATRQGVETFPQPLTLELARRIRAERGPADLVTAFNVFAHADDMFGLGQSIAALLGENGLFAFEVQYLQDIVDKNLLGTIIHEHLNHYSVTTLVTFLKQFSLELISVKRVSIQKGSIIGIAQPSGGRNKPDGSVAAILAEEKRRNLTSFEAIEGFGRSISAMRDKVAAALDVVSAKNGGDVVGYGAARSGPTFMYQLGLAERLAYLLDDHPQKVGKFSPGNGVQVHPTKELSRKQPACAVILAWIHYKTIIGKHIDYLRAGGSFLVLYPEVVLVTIENARQFLPEGGPR